MPNETKNAITPENKITPKINSEQEEATKADVEGSATLEISSSDILKALINGYGKKGTEQQKQIFSDLFLKKLESIYTKHACSKKYNTLIIHDDTILIKSDADKIYEAISNFDKNSLPLLLILFSRGGESESAYLIGKLCREYCNNKFVIVTPRHAKSAATLLACAANEIHMGSLSELGPIDPQINKMPALGLKNSIEHIADLVDKKPNSAEMFAKYLYYAVKPIQIGYYERVAESSVQYAEKLLRSHAGNLPDNPSNIASQLVYGYKDHGFVIDKTEAANIFGEKVVKTNSEEYNFGNDIYGFISEMDRVAGYLDYRICFTGSLKSKPNLIKQEE